MDAPSGRAIIGGMFVKTTRVRRDNRVYEYLSLAEAYRDEGGKTRHRTLVRLGEASQLRDTGELERIIATLKRHVDNDGAGGGGRVAVDDLQAAAAPGLGAVEAVAAWWDRLSLGGLFGGGETAEAVFAMVANRLVNVSPRTTDISESWNPEQWDVKS